LNEDDEVTTPPTTYTFTVNLSSGDTTPEFNVTGGEVNPPVNRMPMPLRNGDTIAFAFNMGTIGTFNSCTFYCWPMGSNSSTNPFVNGGTAITTPLPLVPPVLTAPSVTTITIATAAATGVLSFWEFALAGRFTLASSSGFLTPFFVDPEVECSSGH
jgi:hypothetical protein